MSSKTKKLVPFLVSFYVGLTALLPAPRLVVIPFELVPLWAQLVTVMAGLVFGGSIFIFASRYLECRSSVFQLLSLALGAVWVYYIAGLIVNAPGIRFSCSEVLISIGFAFVWVYLLGQPRLKTDQPGTGDKQ